MRYADRAQAGRTLARSLEHLRGRRPIVLGLPRGGVPVAEAVARAMGADVDILLVRKLGVPWQPELAAGAIGEGGVRVLNYSLLQSVGLSEKDLKPIAAREEAELKRRADAFRRVKPPAELDGRTVVIVDDGIATGATVLAAIEVARAKGAAYVAVATPISAPDAGRRVAATADEFVAPYQPHDMNGVGAAYDDFHQLSDDEVCKLLEGS